MVGASCGETLRMTVQIHDTSLNLCASGHHSDIDMRLMAKLLTADIGTSICQAPRLHGVGIECTCSSRQSSTSARIEMASLSLDSKDDRRPSRALALRMPSDEGEPAFVVSATLEPGLVDVTASVSATHIFVADPEACARLAHDLLSACSALPTALEQPSALETSASRGPPADGPALAVQLDARGCLIRVATSTSVPCSESAASDITVQVGATWVTALLDRSGGQHCDGEISHLCICSVIDREKLELLEPLSISGRAFFPVVEADDCAAAGGHVLLHVGAAHVRLPRSHAEHVQGLLTSLRSPWLASPTGSDGLQLEAMKASTLPSTLPPSRRRHLDLQVRLTSLCTQIGLLQTSIVGFCFRCRILASQQSAACSFDAFAAELEGAGSSFFTMGSSLSHVAGGDQPATVRLEVEMQQDNSMLGCFSCRGLYLRLGPEELDQLLPLFAWDIELPAASDIPFSAEMDLADAEFVLADRLRESTAETLGVLFSLRARASMAGGVHEPARAKYLMHFDRVGVELQHDARSTQLLSPCASALRMHRCKGRIRAVAQTSDIEVQLSLAQLQAVGRVIAAVSTCLPKGESDADGAITTLGVSPLARPPEPSPTSDTVSETSEYFDARDFIDDDPIPNELLAAEVDDIEAAAYLGQVIVTLLEDGASATSPPVLQLSLDASRCLASQRPGAGLAVTACIQLSAYHYVRASARTAQRWEPVLAACRFALALDTARRSFDVCTRGTAEVDVSTRLIGSFHRLKQRALSSHAAVQGDGSSSGAPFVVRNDTGTAMVVWVDDGLACNEAQQLTEVPPGAVAYLSETPMQLDQRGRRVRVIFQGFQQLDVRPTCPPYVRRYRLWPAAERLGSPPIVNVLLDSREENGAELCTFHSRFVLLNSCTVHRSSVPLPLPTLENPTQAGLTQCSCFRPHPCAVGRSASELCPERCTGCSDRQRFAAKGANACALGLPPRLAPLRFECRDGLWLVGVVERRCVRDSAARARGVSCFSRGPCWSRHGPSSSARPACRVLSRTGECDGTAGLWVDGLDSRAAGAAQWFAL